MAANDFIKFYSEYLPKHEDLKAKIDGADTTKTFGRLVMEHGKKAGFNFTEDDVEKVLVASVKKSGAKGELSEGQLEGVVGGTAVPPGGISISPIKSLATVSSTHAQSTLMCPSIF
jgi:hypothetical protein